MQHRNFLFCYLLIGAILLVGMAQGRSAFTIDSSQSRLSLTGKIDGYPLSEQASGSLTTAYKGFLNLNISNSTIQFTGLASVPAITNGIWRPGFGGTNRSSIADYGAQASIPFVGTGYGAGRNIVLDIASPLLNLTGTNFDSSRLIVSMPTNSGATFDYIIGIQEFGSVPLYGISTNAVATGSFISTNGDTIKVVVQINMTITGTNKTLLNFTGKLVATNSVSAGIPPVITSLIATNHNFILTVSNAGGQSQLLGSTNFVNWTPVVATTNVNGSTVVFTTPIAGPNEFFRIQK